MFTPAEKTTKPSRAVQQSAGGTFFRKAAEPASTVAREQTAFFQPAAPIIQPKLEVSQPDDPHEREAERVADIVTHSPERVSSVNGAPKGEGDAHFVSPRITSWEITRIHRSATHGAIQAEDDNILAEPTSSGSESTGIMRRTSGLSPPAMLQREGRGPPAESQDIDSSARFEQTLDAAQGNGMSMDDGTREHMETRFGADFSGVQIHTGATAAALSRSIGADAFALGGDIYFNDGMYAPDTAEGKHLLAHELTHTIQQGAATPVTRGASEEMAEASPSADINTRTKTVSPSLTQGSRGLSRHAMPHAPPVADSQNSQTGHEQEDEAVLGADSSGLAGTISRRASHSEPGIARSIQANTSAQNNVLQRSVGSSIRGAASAVYNAGAGAIDLVSQGLDSGIRYIRSAAASGARAMPGYDALCVILGRDPISGSLVPQTGIAFFRAAMGIMPGGQLLFNKLTQLGIIDAAAAFILQTLSEAYVLVSNVISSITGFIGSIALSDLTDPERLVQRALNIVAGAIRSVVSFAINTATRLLRMVKDAMLRFLAGYVRSRTNAYPLLSVILGEDPIEGTRVAPTGANILSAILELGGDEGREQRRQMQDTGTFVRAAQWIDRGIGVFAGLYTLITTGWMAIWRELSIESLMEPVAAFTRIYNIFAGPIGRALQFARDAALAILQLIKDALLARLSAWAHGNAGYRMLTILIARDIFTGAPVARTPLALLEGFMNLIGAGEQFRQIVQTGVLQRAGAQINAAVARLNMTVAYVIGLFSAIWNSFSLRDLSAPVIALERVLARFAEPVMRLVGFVAEIIHIVVVAILEIMQFPFALVNSIIAQAIQAFDLIKRNPVGFLRNLVAALRQGFVQFFAHILTHLLAGLQNYVMGELREAGIPLPEGFALPQIIRWLLAVLDITIEKMWTLLARRIGQDKVDRVRALIARGEALAGRAAEAWRVIQDIRQNGIMAIVGMIRERLSNLWETVLDAVKNFIMQRVVAVATQRLLALLDVTGIMPAINAAIAIFNAIQSFIRYLREMLEMLNAFVGGVLAIAQGTIAPAAARLEGALARGIPIAIGFLANQLGLRLAERMRSILEGVRARVETAMSWLIDRMAGLAERLVAAGREAVQRVAGWWRARTEVRLASGVVHNLYFEGEAEQAVLTMRSDLTPYEQFVSTTLERTTGTQREAKELIAAAAMAKYRELVTEKARAIPEAPESGREAAERGKARRMQGLINELGDLSRLLFEGTENAGAYTGDKAVARFVYNRNNLAGLTTGDERTVHRMLIESDSWRDTMFYLGERVATPEGLNAPVPYQIVIQIAGRYRDAIVARLRQEPYRLQTSGANPSVEASSDVDLAAMDAPGTTTMDAGSRMLAAETYMRNNYGPHWTTLLRMNFYTDARRLTAYADVRGLMSDSEFADLQQHISQNALILNYAKMLQHARGNSIRTQRVHAVMARVSTPDIRMLAEHFARETEAEAASKLRALHVQIDALQTERNNAGTSADRKIVLARAVTMLQMEANFRTVEANVSPGANRAVVMEVYVVGHEAFQSALSQLEMLEHVIHEAGGILQRAVREYELYKYINRFITASQTGRASMNPVFHMLLDASQQLYRGGTAGRAMLQPISEAEARSFAALYVEFENAAAHTLVELAENAHQNNLDWESREGTLALVETSRGLRLLPPEAGILVNSMQAGVRSMERLLGDTPHVNREKEALRRSIDENFGRL